MDTLRKILYIDDTPSARSLVQRVLAADFEVLLAGDPIEGIELAVQTRPDLILLDINLPNMSGREVAARLSSLLPETVLVAFTADVASGARERALAAGFHGYLTKPLDVDTFAEQVAEFLGGKRDVLQDAARHQQQFAAELVETLEVKVRELTQALERNTALNEQNRKLVETLRRRQRLLEAAAGVGQVITSILNLDELLLMTVETTVQAYQFHFAAVFLLDSAGEAARLRAAAGRRGGQLLEGGFGLPVDESNIVGRAVTRREAYLLRSAADEPLEVPPDLLAQARPRLALPLIVNDKVLGALVIYSDHDDGFHNDDIAALQSLANQAAVAINNARLLRYLEQANHELVRTKTFEAIATATGETIHWVGNKAAPIPSSARRVREDLLQLLAAYLALQRLPEAERAASPLGQWLAQARAEAESQGMDFESEITRLLGLPPRQFKRLGGLDSILEDLTIIEQSAQAILDVKEDFIGPARLQKLDLVELPRLIEQVIFQMNLPAGVVQTAFAPNLPQIKVDARQMGQVYNNLIKNAWEALHQTPEARITVHARLDSDPQFIYTEVEDNGPGIPPEILEKIWVSFFTTKGNRGGTGLGLSACTKIVNQAGGRIGVTSQVGVGTRFSVVLPIAREND